jgi:hypothetical protein
MLEIAVLLSFLVAACLVFGKVVQWLLPQQKRG